LELTKRHLKEGSMVIYSNHTSLLDGFLAYISVMALSGENLHAFGGPAAMKHGDAKRNPLDFIRYLYRFAHYCGVDLVPVVQVGDGYYPQGKTLQSHLAMARMAKRVLRQPGGVVFAAPEGTRSQDGQLLPGQEGIELFGKLGRNTIFMPLAIIPERINRGIRTGQITFRCGETFSYEQIQKEIKTTGRTPVDAMMGRLARLLPENMQGVYRQSNR
jgi:hypothetical protein